MLDVLIADEPATTGEALWFLILIAAMGAGAWRIGRFVSLDSMFEGTREKFYGWLTTGAKLRMWKLKLHDLFTCPFCITGWTSLGIVIGVDIFHHLDLIFIQWLATWTAALCWWGLFDSDDGPKLEHGK